MNVGHVPIVCELCVNCEKGMYDTLSVVSQSWERNLWHPAGWVSVVYLVHFAPAGRLFCIYRPAMSYCTKECEECVGRESIVCQSCVNHVSVVRKGCMTSCRSWWHPAGREPVVSRSWVGRDRSWVGAWRPAVSDGCRSFIWLIFLSVHPRHTIYETDINFCFIDT